MSLSPVPPMLVRIARAFRSHLFWPVLLAAAALHAGVVLSPALVESIELDAAYAKRVESLDRLEERVAHLQKMERALATDRGFRSRVALSQATRGAREGELQIALAEELRFDPQGETVAAARPEWTPPPYESFVRELGEAGPLRVKCIAGAALLCLLGFVFLPVRQES